MKYRRVNETKKPNFTISEKLNQFNMIQRLLNTLKLIFYSHKFTQSLIIFVL